MGSWAGLGGGAHGPSGWLDIAGWSCRIDLHPITCGSSGAVAPMDGGRVRSGEEGRGAAGRAGAILPIALGVLLARWGGAVGAPRPSQRLRAAAIPSWAAGAARRPSAGRCGRRRGSSSLRRTAVRRVGVLLRLPKPGFISWSHACGAAKSGAVVADATFEINTLAHTGLSRHKLPSRCAAVSLPSRAMWRAPRPP